MLYIYTCIRYTNAKSYAIQFALSHSGIYVELVKVHLRINTAKREIEKLAGMKRWE